MTSLQTNFTTGTQVLSGFNKTLLQVRHIQQRIKETSRLPRVTVTGPISTSKRLWFD